MNATALKKPTPDTYRGWLISYDFPPIPVRAFDWSATHPDYDGADDANDSRIVHAATRNDLIAAIEAWRAENVTAEQAVVEANRWAVAARPIVKALFLMEDAEAEVRAGCDHRTWDEARPILSAPQRELREMLDGLRENAICDVLPRHPDVETGTDAEWEAQEAFDEQVRREVTSVDALIKRVAAETNLTVARDGEWAL